MVTHYMADGDSTHSALGHVGPDNQPQETILDMWTTPLDNSSHPVIPQTPDWLGALDSVLGPVPDEGQLSMPALNDPRSSVDPYLGDFLSDLPQPEQASNPDLIPAFDPALLDLTLFNFDGHEQSPGQS